MRLPAALVSEKRAQECLDAALCACRGLVVVRVVRLVLWLCGGALFRLCAASRRVPPKVKPVLEVGLSSGESLILPHGLGMFEVGLFLSVLLLPPFGAASGTSEVPRDAPSEQRRISSAKES